MSIVEIYLCEFFEQEQYVSRHYVSSISKCTLLGRKELSEIEQKLPINLVKQLISEKELQITNEELVEKLVEKNISRERYLYLLLVLK